MQHCTVIHTRHPRLIRRLLATDTLLFRHFCLVGIKFCRHIENLFSTLIFVQIDENKVSQCTFLRHSAVHMMDNNRNMRYQYVLARTGLSDANDRIPPLQQYIYFLGQSPAAPFRARQLDVRIDKVSMLKATFAGKLFTVSILFYIFILSGYHDINTYCYTMRVQIQPQIVMVINQLYTYYNIVDRTPLPASSWYNMHAC